MVLQLVNFGPSAPFVGVAIGGVVIACFVLMMAMVALARTGQWKSSSSRRKRFVIVFLMPAIFLFWGLSTGHGGPKPGGGIVGYAYGGMLHYTTVVSYQPHALAAWSHSLSVRPLALLATLALSIVVVVCAIVACQWRSQRPRT
jgi:hypothetical protein